VSIPTWLSDLAKAVCADILGRPDTFRYADAGWPCRAVALTAAVACQVTH
jgi:hypothetical protein